MSLVAFCKINPEMVCVAAIQGSIGNDPIDVRFLSVQSVFFDSVDFVTITCIYKGDMWDVGYRLDGSLLSALKLN